MDDLDERIVRFRRIKSTQDERNGYTQQEISCNPSPQFRLCARGCTFCGTPTGMYCDNRDCVQSSEDNRVCSKCCVDFQELCRHCVNSGFGGKVMYCRLCWTKEGLKTCSNCQHAHYCCREHQKLDYKNHKRYCCKRLKREPVLVTKILQETMM